MLFLELENEIYQLNASTGLLARGLTSIGRVGDLAPWSWIFIIEGLLVYIPYFEVNFNGADTLQTVGVGAFSYFLLPNTVAEASFLREDERIFAVSRLHQDVPSRVVQDGT